MRKYKTPFSVADGVIRDAAGQEVRLWGVNYYAPFNHNFQNIREMGVDHRKAIDQDLAHMKLMGLDFLRFHLYEREISDAQGNIVENEHLRVFDYLMEKASEEGFYVMITPLTWWNTIENQVMMDRYYAYWHIGVGAAFGFSNYFGKDAMLWNPAARACQKRYLSQLFRRKSTVSGKQIYEHDGVVAVEPFNEPLRKLAREDAVKATSASMDKVFRF